MDMKLYTEEQLREAYNRGRTDWINEIEDYYIFSELTPIELPSDEEIGEYAISNCINVFHEDGLERGAKWMKEQILNQNKL